MNLAKCPDGNWEEKKNIFKLSVILDRLMVSAVLQALHTKLDVWVHIQHNTYLERNALISENLVCSSLDLMTVCAAVSPFKAHGSFYSDK